MTIARFVKPLFANMHHRVHAVAGPCGSQTLHARTRRLHWMASVTVMWSTLSSHSADATFRRPNEFFLVALFAKNVAIDLKCIENHGGKPWLTPQASSELQVELLPRLSRNLSRCCEKGLSAPGVGFLNFETNYLVFSNTSTTKRLHR